MPWVNRHSPSMTSMDDVHDLEGYEVLPPGYVNTSSRGSSAWNRRGACAGRSAIHAADAPAETPTME
jgi:hypothetical protein